MNTEKIEHVKRVELFKAQCKRYGVSYADVARDCDFNVDSFATAMQNYSLSSDRLDTSFESLKKLVYQKGLEYNVQTIGLDPNSKPKLTPNPQ